MKLRILIFCMLFARMAFAEIGYPPAHNVAGGGTNLVVMGGGVKTVTPGANITITDSPTNITISSSGGGGSGTLTNFASNVPWLTGSGSAAAATVSTNATKMPLNVNSDNNAIGLTNFPLNLVLTGLTLSVTAPITGGGNLSANRTFGFDGSQTFNASGATNMDASQLLSNIIPTARYGAEVVQTNNSVFVNAVTNVFSGSGISVSTSGRNKTVAIDSSVIVTNDTVYLAALTNAFGGSGITASGSGRTRSFAVDATVVLTNDSVYVNALTNTTSGTGISVTGSGRSRAVAIDGTVVQTNDSVYVNALTNAFAGNGISVSTSGRNKTIAIDGSVIQTNDAVYVAAVTNVFSGSGISVSTSGRTKTVAVDSSVVLTNNTYFTSIITNSVKAVGATFPTGITNVGMIVYQPTRIKGTLVGVEMTSTNMGTMILDVFKTNSYTLGVIPSVSITASVQPSLILTNLYQNNTLTGWGTAVARGDVFGFKILSCTNSQQVNITLYIQESN